MFIIQLLFVFHAPFFMVACAEKRLLCSLLCSYSVIMLAYAPFLWLIMLKRGNYALSCAHFFYSGVLVSLPFILYAICFV